MGHHVIVGAGTNGQQLARLLADRGEQVTLLSRRGLGAAPGVAVAAVDAADLEALVAATSGASAIYNTANPSYSRWVEDWPPIAAALVAAAERSGAVLVTLSNLYGYGPVEGQMTEATPLAAKSVKGQVRAQMWRDALAAHEAGRIRCVELRASDFFGPGLTDQGMLGERTVPRVLAGRSILGIGRADLPHSWSYVPDVVAALALAAGEERSWGKAWHVPTAAPASLREMVGHLAQAAGVPSPKVRAASSGLLRLLGIFSKDTRELNEVAYQFTAPFIVDSSAFTEAFGMQATPTAEACSATVAWWRAKLASDR